jgi:hypothetical protein
MLLSFILSFFYRLLNIGKELIISIDFEVAKTKNNAESSFFLMPIPHNWHLYKPLLIEQSK